MTKAEKMLPSLSFVLGGAASGKSAWAEKLLLSSGLRPVYVATARVLDAETATKVAQHRSRRRVDWINFEAELSLGPVLSDRAEGEAVLVDCATMWLANHLLDGAAVEMARSELFAALAACPCPVVVVSNEVGHGIVPDNALARDFREHQGRLNIALAEAADLAVMVVAGLPQVLKGRLP